MRGAGGPRGWPSLLNLLRYAYGFRRLHLLPEAAQRLDESAFANLLVCQLVAEVGELVARGLHRAYTPTREWLASPRGRIGVGRRPHCPTTLHAPPQGRGQPAQPRPPGRPDPGRVGGERTRTAARG